MKGFFELFKRSALELKNIRSLVVTALLIALDLAIKWATTIAVTEFLHISFAFVIIASIGMLYGPTVGFIAGMITDILGFIIKPSGAFDIRFTLIEALGALIYGLFLYNARNDKWMIPRIIAAKTAVVIVCNLWLTTWATASLAGKGFLAMLPARAIKNLAQLPIDIIILSIVLPVVLKAWMSVLGNKRVISEKLLFSDENTGKAMITMTVLVMIVVCCLAYSAQYLNDQIKDLKSQIKEQQTTIERFDAELDVIHSELGLERISPAAGEE